LIEIRTILAPTDLSPHSLTAVRYACALAERFGATLHLLHVLCDVLPVGPDPMLAPVLPPEYYTESETESKQALERLLNPAWGRPSAVETSVKWGSPVESVVETAKAIGADMIVIATHGRTGLRHLFLGSVAEQIVREAPCPVLSIRDQT
jgi:universal stress protein A